jgi:hypothetical protein
VLLFGLGEKIPSGLSGSLFSSAQRDSLSHDVFPSLLDGSIR